jgi:hypothetical protein
MKGIQNYFKSPFFCFHGNCGNVCPTDSDFLAYLVALDVDVDFNGNGYLQGVRHAAPYCDHFGLLWWPF